MRSRGHVLFVRGVWGGLVVRGGPEFLMGGGYSRVGVT